MSKSENTLTSASRYAIYIDQLGNLRAIQVGQTETEESLQYHFRGTVGYNQRIIGFFCGNDAQNIKLLEKSAKYDQLIKDLGVEMRDPNGTVWDECKRLQKENKQLEWDLTACRCALVKIRDNISTIDPSTIADITLKVINHQ